MSCTFLLKKVSRNSAYEKNINFQVPQGSFYSTFSRNINLLYSKKLSELIEHLGIMPNPNLQHEWFALYEVHDFHSNNWRKYCVIAPAYGTEVKIEHQQSKPRSATISNLFKYSGEAFYFLSTPSSENRQFAIITDETYKQIYGITLSIKEVLVCLPFHEILSERPCPVLLAPSIMPLLQSTCYLRFGGNYCTGFIMDKTTIISARHLVPFEQQKVGLEIGVRFYPYLTEKTAFISRIGQKSVDLIEIKLSSQVFAKKETANLEQYKAAQKKDNLDLVVGQNVKALGFGKFNFNVSLFHRIQLVLPTIEVGIVSKIINIGYSNVFIKTDVSLFEGFSGCGLWVGEELIGMAIFILNRNGRSSFNKHNFSYTIQFINKLLALDTRQNLISEINAELQCFDRIQTRHKIPLMPRL